MVARGATAAVEVIRTWESWRGVDGIEVEGPLGAHEHARCEVGVVGNVLPVRLVSHVVVEANMLAPLTVVTVVITRVGGEDLSATSEASNERSEQRKGVLG